MSHDDASKTVPHEFLVRIETEAQDIKNICSSKGLGAKKYFNLLRITFYDIYQEVIFSLKNKKNIFIIDEEIRKLFDFHFHNYNMGGMIGDYRGNFQKLREEFFHGLDGIRDRIITAASSDAKKECIADLREWVTCVSAVGALIIMLLEFVPKG